MVDEVDERLPADAPERDGPPARSQQPARPARVGGIETPPVTVRSGARFEGLVWLPASGRIDGRVEGEVVAGGTLWIGPAAAVVGPVRAANAVVAGRIEGDVQASGRIALEATAQVRGEVSAQRLVLAEGSFLEGSCQAGETASAGAAGGGAAGSGSP